MNWQCELLFLINGEKGRKWSNQCHESVVRVTLIFLINGEKDRKRSNQCSKSLGHARAMAPAGVEGLIADLLAQNPWHSILHKAWQEVNKKNEVPGELCEEEQGLRLLSDYFSKS